MKYDDINQIIIDSNQNKSFIFVYVMHFSQTNMKNKKKPKKNYKDSRRLISSRFSISIMNVISNFL